MNNKTQNYYITIILALGIVFSAYILFSESFDAMVRQEMEPKKHFVLENDATGVHIDFYVKDTTAFNSLREGKSISIKMHAYPENKFNITNYTQGPWKIIKLETIRPEPKSTVGF